MKCKRWGDSFPRAYLLHRSNHGAFTLIELCVVMAALTLVVTATTMLLHAMMRQQAAGGKQLLAGRSLMRLSDRFRKDVQVALEARIDNAAQITLVQPEDTIVSYSYQNTGAIRRTLRAGDATRKDEFDLWGAAEISFARRNYPDAQALVILSVEPVAVDGLPSDTAASRDPQYVVTSGGTTVIAELGRDHRWNNIRPLVDDSVHGIPLAPIKSPTNDAKQP